MSVTNRREAPQRPPTVSREAPLEREAGRLAAWGSAGGAIGVLCGAALLVWGSFSLSQGRVTAIGQLGGGLAMILGGFWWSSWHEAMAVQLKALSETLQQVRQHEALLTRLARHSLHGGALRRYRRACRGGSGSPVSGAR